MQTEDHMGARPPRAAASTAHALPPCGPCTWVPGCLGPPPLRAPGSSLTPPFADMPPAPSDSAHPEPLGRAHSENSGPSPPSAPAPGAQELGLVTGHVVSAQTPRISRAPPDPRPSRDILHVHSGPSRPLLAAASHSHPTQVHPHSRLSHAGLLGMELQVFRVRLLVTKRNQHGAVRRWGDPAHMSPS